MTPFHCEAPEDPTGRSSSLSALQRDNFSKDQSPMAPIKKYSLVLPSCNHNPALRSAHTLAKNWLVDTFGGFSAYDGVCAWQDERGARHVEAHARYEVADFQRLGSGRFTNLARRVLERAGEECLYIEIDGAPQILENEK